MAAVDVSYSIAGLTVTSVDLGVPVGTFLADGSQIDPETLAPFVSGTFLNYDEDDILEEVFTNQDDEPVVTVNSSQTWTVSETSLRRESLIFDRPTQFGKYRRPIDWIPVNQISAEWGKIQMIVGGRDVTYFRDFPAEMGPWSSNEPNGDAATSVFFPQISWWERPKRNHLSWMRQGSNVTILLIRPNGSRKTLFEGLVVGWGYSGQGHGVSLDILGCLYQADHTPYMQELHKRTRDIGNAIANIMDRVVSNHYRPCNRPNTGIETNIRGSGGASLTQGVQDILSTAFTAGRANQWTITNLPGRRPHIRLKDKTTRHWSMAMGHPGLDLNITNDFQQDIGVIWGSGIGPKGDSWFNAKYPGIRIETAPNYPLAPGSIFVAGSGTLGFDEFSDELRTRGFTMHSRDTYSVRDVEEVRTVQRRSGITIDGQVGAQTWSTVFGVGGSFASLADAYISPIAIRHVNRKNNVRADGSIIGPNLNYVHRRLAMGRYEEYGDVSKEQGVKSARDEAQVGEKHEPHWVGSATFEMDPEEGSRWEMKAGENLYVKFMFPPPKRIGLDDGLLLHMSQVSVTPGGSVTAQLSFLGHDMTTLASIRSRNKDTRDPARRQISGRRSRISEDRTIPWDSEAGGGKIPMHNLQGGHWLTFPIPAGQIGTISEVLYICATPLNSDTITTAFNNGSALPGAKEFCVAIFSKPVTANFLQDLVGNPLTKRDTWGNNAAKLEKAGLLQAYGASDQAAGFWPGQGSKGDLLTGKMLDGSSWPWESVDPPYLFIAEYCKDSTRIAGQLRNAPFGS